MKISINKSSDLLEDMDIGLPISLTGLKTNLYCASKFLFKESDDSSVKNSFDEKVSCTSPFENFNSLVNNFGAKFLEKLKEGETTGRNSPKISASLMQNRKALPLISRISGNTEKEPFRLLCLKEKWKESEFHNIIFNPNTTFEIFYDHLIEVYQSLLKGINILNIPSLEEIANKSFELNNRSPQKEKVLFFELELTLISFSIFSMNENNYVQYLDPKANLKKKFFNTRPYLLESLKTLSQYYEIYIFTTLSQKIASKIIWILDPEKKIFKGIIRREYCYKTQDNILIKDLRIIKNKNLKDLVIINSNCNSFVSQIDNAIPLLPWYGDLEDSELIYLTKYLFYLSKCDDVRDKNKEYFKLLQLSSKTLQDFYFL